MSRSSRQAEIDAMIAEMMNTAPAVKVHPKIRGEEEPASAKHTADGAVIVSAGGEAAENEGPSDSEEDEDNCADNTAPLENIILSKDVVSSSHDPTAQDTPEEPPEEPGLTGDEAMDLFALDRKVPISHQVRKYHALHT